MRTRSTWLATIAFLAVAGVLPNASMAGVPSFTGLGDFPGGAYFSIANGVSPDGSTVVGTSEHASGMFQVQAFRWTAATGMVGIGDFPGGPERSGAWSASYDGSVIVGDSWTATTQEAFCWTAADGMVGIGGLSGGGMPSSAGGISADGTVIVGFGDTPAFTREAFRWTAETGAISLGDLPGGEVHSEALCVSTDGQVAAGISSSANGMQAFRWTDDGGMIGLGGMPGLPDGVSYNTAAHALSADGSVIVGNGRVDADWSVEAFRWTAGGGMVSLGDLPGGFHDSSAAGVTADGAIIVGEASVDSGTVPFIWDEQNGMRNLRTVLEEEYGLDFGAWTLTRATGISADGLTIVGNGFNPDGNIEGWIVTIPEPSAAILLAFGASLVARRRR